MSEEPVIDNSVLIPAIAVHIIDLLIFPLIYVPSAQTACGKGHSFI